MSKVLFLKEIVYKRTSEAIKLNTHQTALKQRIGRTRIYYDRVLITESPRCNSVVFLLKTRVVRDALF